MNNQYDHITINDSDSSSNIDSEFEIDNAMDNEFSGMTIIEHNKQDNMIDYKDNTNELIEKGLSLVGSALSELPPNEYLEANNGEDSFIHVENNNNDNNNCNKKIPIELDNLEFNPHVVPENDDIVNELFTSLLKDRSNFWRSSLVSNDISKRRKWALICKIKNEEKEDNLQQKADKLQLTSALTDFADISVTSTEGDTSRELVKPNLLNGKQQNVHNIMLQLRNLINNNSEISKTIYILEKKLRQTNFLLTFINEVNINILAEIDYKITSNLQNAYLNCFKSILNHENGRYYILKSKKIVQYFVQLLSDKQSTIRIKLLATELLLLLTYVDTQLGYETVLESLEPNFSSWLDNMKSYLLDKDTIVNEQKINHAYIYFLNATTLLGEYSTVSLFLLNSIMEVLPNIERKYKIINGLKEFGIHQIFYLMKILCTDEEQEIEIISNSNTFSKTVLSEQINLYSKIEQDVIMSISHHKPMFVDISFGNELQLLVSQVQKTPLEKPIGDLLTTLIKLITSRTQSESLKVMKTFESMLAYLINSLFSNSNIHMLDRDDDFDISPELVVQSSINDLMDRLHSDEIAKRAMDEMTGLEHNLIKLKSELESLKEERHADTGELIKELQETNLQNEKLHLELKGMQKMLQLSEEKRKEDKNTIEKYATHDRYRSLNNSNGSLNYSSTKFKMIRNISNSKLKTSNIGNGDFVRKSVNNSLYKSKRISSLSSYLKQDKGNDLAFLGSNNDARHDQSLSKSNNGNFKQDMEFSQTSQESHLNRVSLDKNIFNNLKMRSTDSFFISSNHNNINEISQLDQKEYLDVSDLHSQAVYNPSQGALLKNSFKLTNDSVNSFISIESSDISENEGFHPMRDSKNSLLQVNHKHKNLNNYIPIDGRPNDASFRTTTNHSQSHQIYLPKFPVGYEVNEENVNAFTQIPSADHVFKNSVAITTATTTGHGFHYMADTNMEDSVVQRYVSLQQSNPSVSQTQPLMVQQPPSPPPLPSSLEILKNNVQNLQENSSDKIEISKYNSIASLTSSPPPPPPLPPSLTIITEPTSTLKSESLEAKTSPLPPPPPPLPPSLKFDSEEPKILPLAPPPPPPPPPLLKNLSQDMNMEKGESKNTAENIKPEDDNIPAVPPFLTHLNIQKEDKKLKQIHWIRVNEVAETIWKDNDRDRGIFMELECVGVFDRVKSSFKLKDVIKKKNTDEAKTKDKQQLKSFLSRDLAQQFGINLHLFASCEVSELLEKVLRCDNDINKNITILEFFNKEEFTHISGSVARNYAPYGVDYQTNNEATKDASELERADRIFLELFYNLRAYWAERSQCLLLLHTYEKDYFDLMFKLQRIDDAVQKLMNSTRFKKFLYIVLEIGNFMNKKPAEGILISSLTKLVFIKSSENNNLSFLHFIEKTIRTQFPEVYGFIDDLSKVAELGNVSLDHITMECKEFCTHVNTTVYAVTKGKLSHPEDLHPRDQILKKVKYKISKAKTKSNFLRDQQILTNHSIVKVLKYYGEDPNDRDSKDDFFKNIAEFATLFKKCAKENIYNEEAERLYEQRKYMLDNKLQKNNSSGDDSDLEKNTENDDAVDKLLLKLRGVENKPEPLRRRRSTKLLSNVIEENLEDTIEISLENNKEEKLLKRTHALINDTQKFNQGSL
ncbi:hypothetical protein TPHA_0E00120 [Tetrapisispora phaffii CBS 4417]|uniref:FH2 domain-containing protein n=1 Tax=Tetrapisispora phaffii (strain ATCC 24235 / CBS 4417 / NBRC 1672 / NRRL Y-8282 / UCD 70-5) TaxID=1071381 RepID=G8BT81_TETPH|nr:hypothetical protein TPHA_0E00120 [Tetrapisispora phaffii CBS 4417]CCE63109.1 hypothetical protein TPHA_0E00120 [Tetrapisispora phaffii CBS 4417]